MTTFFTRYQPKPLEAIFGYFNSSCSTTESMKKMHRTINLMNGLGYIPLVGTTVGIARILFFSQFIPKSKSQGNKERVFCCLQISRGCIELFALGAVFLIPDLIFTINRELETARTANTHYFSNTFGQW